MPKIAMPCVSLCLWKMTDASGTRPSSATASATIGIAGMYPANVLGKSSPNVVYVELIMPPLTPTISIAHASGAAHAPGEESRADIYYPIIVRAVSQLPNNTPEARQTVYDHARMVLIARLGEQHTPKSKSELTTAVIKSAQNLSLRHH